MMIRLVVFSFSFMFLIGCSAFTFHIEHHVVMCITIIGTLVLRTTNYK